MEFGVLGPVRLAAEGQEQELASTAQRALIAVLALADGRIVSRERLIEGLWQEDPSPRRVRNLQFHVSKLRDQLRRLEPARPSRIVTQAAGYRLEVTGARIDSAEFGRLTAAARACDRSDLTAASGHYQQALSLWRGPALADVADLSLLLGSEAARLDEQRVNAVEEYAEIEVRAGHHHQIAAELAYLSAQLPLRERLTSLLMLALYRCGRQAEALAAYAAYRRALATELGLDPRAELQELHRKILTGDPGLVRGGDLGRHRAGRARPAPGHDRTRPGRPRGHRSGR